MPERFDRMDQIDDMAPGPELGQVLASIDRKKLDGYGLVVLMKARARQVAHLQAEFYADMWAVMDAEERLAGEGVFEFTSEEIQAALSCTRRAADRHLGLAHDLNLRFPQVARALSEGRIDLPKARVICERLAVADQEVAARLVDLVLEKASGQTTGQIAARIDRLVIAADPEAARQRYQRSVADRHVTLEQDSDGTATLTGFRLPADRALRALDQVNLLAGRLRVKGETRNMDQLRADVLLDLLEGRQLPTGGGRGVVDLRIDLTTLAGLDDQPAEVAGWGPLLADVARRMVEDRAQWRVTVTAPDTGEPVWTGTTRRRPTAAQRRMVAAYHPTCVFMGCRAPATRADLDHNRPWAQGGPTTAANLGPLCPRHHTAKDQGGWTLEQL
ncbi:MAG TPA: DUF222 domain-containing protein, partial [Acidimicrobiia bacterium]|nr:DUF222 domain-containing protein [Acidimicrobiia bacterium]